MEDEELTPIVEELTKVLEGKASREEIEQEVSKFANQYKLTDPAKIKASVLKKLGPSTDTSFVTADHVRKKIGDLKGNEVSVDIVAKVLSVEMKTATIKGSLKHLLSGTVGDETGQAQFTIWDGNGVEMEAGLVYVFKNAYTKTWNNRIQINIGSKGYIDKGNVDIDVTGASSAGQSWSSAKMKIADLKGTETNVDLEVRIISADRKTVMIRGENRDIISGTLADETGQAQFTIWNAEENTAEADGTYEFKSAYTKLWNDQVQVNIGNKGNVNPIDKDIVASSAPVIQTKPVQTAPGVKMKIADLKGTESNVDLEVKVVFEEKRDVIIKGETRTIISGILGDETGTASFTAWDASTVSMEKGSAYLVSNAYTKVWNDRIQINLGNRCSISKLDKNITPPERQIEYNPSIAKIKDLKEGIGSVTVSGKILSVECKTINSRGEDKKVWSGILADETGKVQYSAWNDFGLSEGEAVRIENGYIREWKGIPRLNIGERSTVDRIDDTFGDLSASTASKKTVGEIMMTNGGLDICVTGTIMDIRAGSGIIKRCPECNRSILSNECMTHGTVVPIPDLRMKAILDDGTGAMSTIVNREVTEKLTGITLDQAEEYAAENGESSVAKLLGERVLMRNITFRGDVMSDEYGPLMIVRSAEPDSRDVAKEAEKLLAEVEEAMM